MSELQQLVRHFQKPAYATAMGVLALALLMRARQTHLLPFL